MKITLSAPAASALFIVLALFGSAANAAIGVNQCVKINRSTCNTDKNAADYVEPDTNGVANICGSFPNLNANSGIALSNQPVNVQDLAFQPLGTVISSGSGTFMSHGYSPEQVLYRCGPNTKSTLSEYYATKGNAQWDGQNLAASKDGGDGATIFQANYQSTGFAIRNDSTGQWFNRNWKRRELTNITVDSQGAFLVKAKDFSQGFTMNVVRLNNNGPYIARAAPVIWVGDLPQAYIAFQGGGIGNNLRDGGDSINQRDNENLWPAQISLHAAKVQILAVNTCRVLSNINAVTFRPVTAAELNAGPIGAQVPLVIQYSCTNNLVSGTAPGQVAFSVAINPQDAGGNVSGLTASHLLSKNYGASNVAQGVEIRILSNNNVPMQFLTNEYAAGSEGWYPIHLSSASNGSGNWTKTLYPQLERLPDRSPIVPGKIDAIAKFVIRMQ